MAVERPGVWRYVGEVIGLVRGAVPVRDSLARTRRDNTALCLLLAFVSLPWFALLFVMQGDSVAGLACLLSVAGAFGGTLMLRHGMDAGAAAHVLAFTVFLLLVYLVYRVGGIASPSVVWMPVCALIATAGAGARGGLRWAGITMLALAAIYGADFAGLFRPAHIADLRVLSLIGHLCFVALVAVFMLLYERNNAVAFGKLNAAMKTIEVLATRDELTGVYNRRELLRIARQEKLRCDRLAVPLAFCIVDIDLFKSVNDTWGHLQGDRVLARVAAAIESTVRASDCFGRYGGEEFVVVMPGSDLAGGFEFAERMRLTVAGLAFPELEGRAVTISAGIAQNGVARPVEQSLADADRALYRAKAGGRNRVELAAP